MHEAFLAAGARKLVYPDSGPGPISAVGTDDVAYFGEVSNAELFTSDEFVAQIPELFGASVINDNLPWLKFRYYGKFLFIKKFPIFKKTSGTFKTNWGNLYNAGLVYGVDGPGAYNYSSDVTQLRLVKKSAYTFKVRTITGDTTETATGFNTSNSGQKDAGIRKSMFTELIYRVCNEVVPGYNEPKFAKNSYTLLISGEHEICREINKSGPSTGIALLRGNAYTSSPGITTYTFTSTFANLDVADRWRPVLELVDSNELFNMSRFQVRVTGLLSGAVSDVQFGIQSASSGGTTIERLTNFTTSKDTKKQVAGLMFTPESYSIGRLDNFQTSRTTKYKPAITSVVPSGDPARLGAIYPTTKPIMKINAVTYTFNP